MVKLFPLHAKVGRPPKPKRKKGKRKRAASGSLRGAAPKIDRAERSIAARLADLEKLRALRSPNATKTSSRAALNKPSTTRASLDVAKLKARLREMPPNQIVAIWRNAIKLLAQEAGRRRDAGRQAVEAIEKEWKRRRLLPLSPEDFFNWPSTDAPGGSGNLSFSDAQSEGMLSYLEYRVGRTQGIPAAVRKVILDRVFSGELPPVFPRGYMDEWRAPGSSGRLQKMAEALAAFGRNAKRRDADLLSDAIRDWENDLRYLYDTYYVAKFRFGWPSTSL